MLDAVSLAAGLRIPLERAETWAPLLDEAMHAFDINATANRVAAFLAQCAHESAFLTRWVEDLDYRTAQRLVDVYGRAKFPDLGFAAGYVRSPDKLAEYVYGWKSIKGRELGNFAEGDGALYIGRGLIQITGRRNYERMSDGLETDYVGNPDLLLDPHHAALGSAWWWADQAWRRVTLNEMADEGMIDAISGLVNRGNPDKVAIGADERRRIYHDVLDVITA
jgi:putative chitinase